MRRPREHGHGRRPLSQYALLAGPLLSMLDSSIVNVAAEPIARALHAPLGTVQWTVSGYLLALGTGLAGTAYLARRYGTVPVYRVSLAAFTVASALCALSPGAGALIAFRAVQGLVAAPLVPLAMSMLLGKSGGARSISPVAGILLFAAPALGPTVGGALIGAGGWRLIFAVNLPFGLLAGWAAKRLPRGVGAYGPAEKNEFDFYGLVMLAAGVTLVLLGTSQGGTDGWGAAACWGRSAGAALLAAYARWAAGRARPALDLSLARQPMAALSMGLCALAAVVTWAAVFLLPVFAQTAQGRSALAAGVAMAPQGVITGLSTALGPRAAGAVHGAGDRVRRVRRAGGGEPAVADGRGGDAAVADLPDSRGALGVDRAGDHPAAHRADRAAAAGTHGGREHAVQRSAEDGGLVRHRAARVALRAWRGPRRAGGRAARDGRRDRVRRRGGAVAVLLPAVRNPSVLAGRGGARS